MKNKEGTTQRGTWISVPFHVSVREWPLEKDAHGKQARRGPARNLPVEPVTAALLAGLAEQNVVTTDALWLEPEGVRQQLEGDAAVRRRQEFTADDVATLKVVVQENELAAVLIEQDGVYAWHLPQESERSDNERLTAQFGRRQGGAIPPNRVLTFSLSAPAPGSALNAARRGWLSDKLVGALIDPLRVIVLRFAAHKLVETSQQLLDKGIVPGLVGLHADNPAAWITLAPPHIRQPVGRPVRVLLLVHGAFSSTCGSFGALGLTESGRVLLARARDRYDAVLGYDHATLGTSPEENAATLLDALLALGFNPQAELDILAFSRGALVTRFLVERLLPERGWPFKVNRAVFVGATNGGTALAEPANWTTLLDLYTNLAVAAGRALALLDAGTASTIITEGVKTLGGLVRAVVDAAITDEMVPGLAAMRPTSALVAALNDPAASVLGDGPDYFTLGSDFDVMGLSGPALGLPQRLPRILADAGVDRLMGQANDLVVNTEAMGQFGVRSSRVKGSLRWEANPAC